MLKCGHAPARSTAFVAFFAEKETIVFGKKLRRRDARRQCNREGWITMKGVFAQRHCDVLDISPSGARIRIDDIRFLSGRFNLKLAREEATGRLCRIAWRDGGTVGLEFIVDS